MLMASGDGCDRREFSQALVSPKPNHLGKWFSTGVEAGDLLSQVGMGGDNATNI